VLFDPRPKEIRDELFDRESELFELERSAKHGALIVLCVGGGVSAKSAL
jgi:hypothetical protein